MTRWARGGSANKKKPLEASSWKALKDGSSPAAESAGATTSSIATRATGNLPKVTMGSRDAGDCQKGKTLTGKNKKKREKLIISAVKNTTKPKEAQSSSVSPVSKTSTMHAPLVWAREHGGSSVVDELMGVGRGGSGSLTVPPVELLEYIRKDRRREARRVKRADVRQTSRVCFKCREPGHDLSTCPQIAKDVEQGTGICFKCGSTEHTVSQCRANVPAGKFPFAKCFICKETGHLSRACPDNPRGLYPNGGCCNLCESVEHFRKDCPELQKQQGIQDVRIATIRQGSSLDADDFSTKRSKMAPPALKTNHKVVKF